MFICTTIRKQIDVFSVTLTKIMRETEIKCAAHWEKLKHTRNHSNTTNIVIGMYKYFPLDRLSCTLFILYAI